MSLQILPDPALPPPPPASASAAKEAKAAKEAAATVAELSRPQKEYAAYRLLLDSQERPPPPPPPQQRRAKAGPTKWVGAVEGEGGRPGACHCRSVVAAAAACLFVCVVWLRVVVVVSRLPCLPSREPSRAASPHTTSSTPTPPTSSLAGSNRQGNRPAKGFYLDSPDPLPRGSAGGAGAAASGRRPNCPFTEDEVETLLDGLEEAGGAHVWRHIHSAYFEGRGGGLEGTDRTMIDLKARRAASVSLLPLARRLSPSLLPSFGTRAKPLHPSFFWAWLK